MFVLATGLLSAQDQDPKARAVLDELSKKTKSYNTMSAEVVFTTYGKDKKPAEKPQTWKLLSKGEKFRLEIPGTQIVCDGKTLWNYNKDAQEFARSGKVEKSAEKAREAVEGEERESLERAEKEGLKKARH